MEESGDVTRDEQRVGAGGGNTGRGQCELHLLEGRGPEGRGGFSGLRPREEVDGGSGETDPRGVHGVVQVPFERGAVLTRRTQRIRSPDKFRDP